MPTIEVKVPGLNVLDGQLQNLPRELQQAVQAGLLAVAMTARNEAVRLVQQPPKTGRFYGRHQASAPGEAPATDTGALVGSIVAEPQPENMSAVLVARMPYAVHLEFGTRNMAARPFLAPAARFALQSSDRIMTAYVNRVFGIR